MGILSVNYNRLNSFNDLNLVIEYRYPIPAPEKNIRIIEVDGRNGSLTEDLGTYKDIEVPISFGLVDKVNVHEKARKIKSWLIGMNYDDKLIISDDPDYYYKAKYVKFASNIERMLTTLGKFTAVFVCDPFKYSVYDDLIITLGNQITRTGIAFDPLQSYSFTSGTVYQNNVPVRSSTGGSIVFINNGTFYSKPITTIFGTGDISITLNSNTFYIKAVNQYVTINSEAENAYKVTLPMNNQMIGEVPLLIPGINTLSWTGSIDRIEIQCNSIWL